MFASLPSLSFKYLSLLAMTGIGLPAQAALITEIEPNNTVSEAQNVDAHFTQNADPLIANASLVPHVSILGSGNFQGDRDFFSFTATAGATATFDIDGGMPDLDPWLNLFSASGILLWSNDDGGVVDPGSVHDYDSFGSYTFSTNGLYVVSVQRWPGSGLNAGQDYRLNLSVENHSLPQAVPEPGTIGLLGMGLMGLGFAARRRSKYA